MAKNSISGKADNLTQLKLLSRVGNLGILIGFVVMMAIFSLLSPYFLKVDNLLAIALQSSINAVIALGMTMVIITGGIDLSVGSVVALAGVVMATLMKNGTPVLFAVGVGFLIGLVCGALNGVLISKVKLAPFIVTLGSMSFIRGIALLYTNGQPIYGVPAAIRWLGSGSLGIVPVPVLIATLAAIITFWLLRRTKIGEYTLAMGGNEEATRLSGINVDRYKMIIYIFSGLCSALGAILLTARVNAAEPIAGANFEMDAIAAAVMGGTSLSGGVGSVWGTISGALIIGGLRNGLNLLNVQAFYQQVAIGIVIVLACVIDKLRKAG